MTTQSARFVVDRREGALFVIEDAQGVCRDVPEADLPDDCRAEGAVLEVPLRGGTPQWARATRDRAEERRRVTDLTNRMRRLREKDSGGDIEL